MPALVARIEDEQMRLLFQWLQGDPDASTDGLVIFHQPHLTAEQAFGVVYYLQQQLNLLPKHYDLCRVCNRLYNAHTDGEQISGEYGFCNDHRPSKESEAQ